MNFTPLDESDKYELLPPGEYAFFVQKASEKLSKNHNPMIEMQVKIQDLYDKSKSGIVFVYLLNGVISESMDEEAVKKEKRKIFKLRNFCLSVGLDEQYKKGDLKGEDCIGKEGICKVTIEEDKNGKYPPKNSIADFIEGKNVGIFQKNEPVEGTTQFEGDDIPF